MDMNLQIGKDHLFQGGDHMHSKFLMDEYPIIVYPTLAEKIGLNESIFVQKLHFWINQSGKKRDGRKWIWNTQADWHVQFPFFSLSTLKRTIDSCKKAGLVIKGNYNKTDYDRTLWYTIDYDMFNAIVELEHRDEKGKLIPLEERVKIAKQKIVDKSDKPCNDALVQNEQMRSDALVQNELMDKFNLNQPIPYKPYKQKTNNISNDILSGNKFPAAAEIPAAEKMDEPFVSKDSKPKTENPFSVKTEIGDFSKEAFNLLLTRFQASLQASEKTTSLPLPSKSKASLETKLWKWMNKHVKVLRPICDWGTKKKKLSVKENVEYKDSGTFECLLFQFFVTEEKFWTDTTRRDSIAKILLSFLKQDVSLNASDLLRLLEMKNSNLSPSDISQTVLKLKFEPFSFVFERDLAPHLLEKEQFNIQHRQVMFKQQQIDKAATAPPAVKKETKQKVSTHDDFSHLLKYLNPEAGSGDGKV